MLPAETRDAQHQWENALALVRGPLLSVKAKRLYQLSSEERQHLRTCIEKALPQIEEADERLLFVQAVRERASWQRLGVR